MASPSAAFSGWWEKISLMVTLLGLVLADLRHDALTRRLVEAEQVLLRLRQARAAQRDVVDATTVVSTLLLAQVGVK